MEFAIVDDVKHDCHRLEQMVVEFLDTWQISCPVSTFVNGKQFLENFTPDRYEAVFLDICMEDISGMEVAHKLRQQFSHTKIVFTTSEESYALEGYRVQALDYLIKPIQPDQVNAVMERILGSQGSRHFIGIKENRVNRQILLEDILYVRSIGHFLEIYLDNQEMCRSYMTLNSLLDQIHAFAKEKHSILSLQFPVCCRGYVVNLEKVQLMEQEHLLLKHNITIPISRPRRKEMQKIYADYIFARTRNKR